MNVCSFSWTISQDLIQLVNFSPTFSKPGNNLKQWQHSMPNFCSPCLFKWTFPRFFQITLLIQKRPNVPLLNQTWIPKVCPNWTHDPDMWQQLDNLSIFPRWPVCQNSWIKMNTHIDFMWKCWTHSRQCLWHHDTWNLVWHTSRHVSGQPLAHAIYRAVKNISNLFLVFYSSGLTACFQVNRLNWWFLTNTLDQHSFVPVWKKHYPSWNKWSQMTLLHSLQKRSLSVSLQGLVTLLFINTPEAVKSPLTGFLRKDNATKWLLTERNWRTRNSILNYKKTSAWKPAEPQ